MKDTDSLAYELTGVVLKSILVLILGTIFGAWAKWFWIGWVFKTVLTCIE